MAFNLFGFKFGTKAEEEQNKNVPPSFIPPPNTDGSLVIETGSGFGFYGQYVNLDGTIKSDRDLIMRYREMAQSFEVDSAISDIVNESIITSTEEINPIKLDLDNIPKNQLSDKIKKQIIEEFDYILQLLNFSRYGPDIFRSWYVDSRLYYQVMIDTTNTERGIQELRYIDPTKITKVVEHKKTMNDQNIEVIADTIEYFVYNPIDHDAVNATQQIRIPVDSILLATSGMLDTRNSRVVGHLHKAIKPLNQLKMMEDALVIYRIARAPERRIFYIDVGNLPKTKAEQYVKDIMNRYKNKLVYDAATGEMKDDKRIQSMIEDFWMPRREGGKGTEVTSLPGGQNLGELADVDYFKKKLYMSLKVPISRLETEKGFTLGRTTEITRDEVKFAKFINSLRNRFSELFLQALRVQLILKNILSEEDWDEIANLIRFEYAKDTYFSELKEIEITNERMNVLNGMSTAIGTFYSKQWVQKNILRLTDEEIEEMQKQIDAEKKEDPQAFITNPALAMGAMGGDPSMGGMPGQMPGMPGQQGFGQPQGPAPFNPQGS